MLITIQAIEDELVRAKAAGADELIIRESPVDRDIRSEWLQKRKIIDGPKKILDNEGMAVVAIVQGALRAAHGPGVSGGRLTFGAIDVEATVQSDPPIYVGFSF